MLPEGCQGKVRDRHGVVTPLSACKKKKRAAGVIALPDDSRVQRSTVKGKNEGFYQGNVWIIIPFLCSYQYKYHCLSYFWEFTVFDVNVR